MQIERQNVAVSCCNPESVCVDEALVCTIMFISPSEDTMNRVSVSYKDLWWATHCKLH